MDKFFLYSLLAATLMTFGIIFMLALFVPVDYGSRLLVFFNGLLMFIAGIVIAKQSDKLY